MKQSCLVSHKMLQWQGLQQQITLSILNSPLCASHNLYRNKLTQTEVRVEELEQTRSLPLDFPHLPCTHFKWSRRCHILYKLLSVRMKKRRRKGGAVGPGWGRYHPGKPQVSIMYHSHVTIHWKERERNWSFLTFFKCFLIIQISSTFPIRAISEKWG